MWVWSFLAGRTAWSCWAVWVSDRKPYKSDLSDEPVGADRAGDVGVESRPPVSDWASGSVRDAGDRQRDPVPGQDRLPVGLPPARPAAEVGRLLLLRGLARRRHGREDQRLAALAGPREGRAVGGPEPGRDRHTERPRGGKRARHHDWEDAAKKCRAASAGWRWTSSAWSPP